MNVLAEHLRRPARIGPREERSRWWWIPRLPRRGILLAVLVLGCAFAPWVTSLDPESLDLDARLAPPSATHPLGTDAMGRDLLARTLYGGRVSLGIGLSAALLGTAIGIFVGAAAATGGRRTETALMAGVDLALAMPALFLALLLGARAEGDVLALALVLTAFSWMEPARIVRTGLARLRGGELAAAARASGASRLRIVCRHLLPQVSGQVRASFLLAFAHAVLAEATLSFLGFGVRPPYPSWGTLIAGARFYVATAPWMLLGPVAFLFLALWSANGLGRRAARP